MMTTLIPETAPTNRAATMLAERVSADGADKNRVGADMA